MLVMTVKFRAHGRQSAAEIRRWHHHPPCQAENTHRTNIIIRSARQAHLMPRHGNESHFWQSAFITITQRESDRHGLAICLKLNAEEFKN